MINDILLGEIINPKKSIFVSANAGSGKTFTLIARVLGLLLSGEEPEKILCITYTNTAANEMRLRLQKQLHKWQNAKDYSDDPILKNASKDVLLKAKKLYTEVVLSSKFPKILTFHTFCFEILTRFPVESGLSYGLSISSNLKSKEIKKSVLKSIILDDTTKHLVKELSGRYKLAYIASDIIPLIISSKYIDYFTGNVDIIRKPYEILNLEYLPGSFQKLEGQLRDTLLRQIDISEIQNLIQNLREISPLGRNDSKILKTLEDFVQDPEKHAFDFCYIFLTQAAEVSSRSFTKKTLEIIDGLCELAAHYSNISYNIIWKRIDYSTAKITEIISCLARYVITEYEAIKAKNEVCDFDDLINKTNAAFKMENRDFILFKLDGGINHILVDEAQDTNRKQWEILSAILEEFFAGSGAREGNRSLFVVGDEKQSIYSFQGAQPKILNEILKKYNNFLLTHSINCSYRTSSAVLGVVDEIFQNSDYEIVIDKSYTPHFSERKLDYGKIGVLEIPIFVCGLAEDESIFSDMGMSEKYLKLIAKQIVMQIKQLLQKPRFLPKHNRNLRPSDIMLLSKTRDPKLFFEISNELRACLKSNDLYDQRVDFGQVLRTGLKSNDLQSTFHKIRDEERTLLDVNEHRKRKFYEKDEQRVDFKPVLREVSIGISFIDQIKYKESLPLQDFICLLKYLIDPTDHYALACILKSPIFRMKDKDLEEIFLCNADKLDLFHNPNNCEKLFAKFEGEERTLHVVNEHRRQEFCEEGEQWVDYGRGLLHDTGKIPNDLLNLKYLPNLSLEEFFLELYAKFSIKYCDAERQHIMQIFPLIKEYQAVNNVYSFEGFLQFFAKNQNESFKIEDEAMENNIRISTIHGAKGLESPVVFILNATEVHARSVFRNPFVFKKEENTLLFSGAYQKARKFEELREEEVAAEYKEYLRLLYVALTRAEDELYVFGKKSSTAKDEESFYDIIQKAVFKLSGSNFYETGTAIEQCVADICDDYDGSGKKKSIIVSDSTRIKLPDAVNQKFVIAAEKARYVHEGLDFGKAIHFLLALNRLVARNEMEILLLKQFPEIREERMQSLINTSLNVRKQFPYLFESNALSEVEVIANFEGSFFIGKIDKLVILEGKIEIIDFKYYVEQEITPEIRSQLSKYKLAVLKLYPEKEITTSILWINEKGGCALEVI